MQRNWGRCFLALTPSLVDFYADQNHVQNLMRDARLARIFACIYSWLSL